MWSCARYFCQCVLRETESNVFIINSSSSRLAQWATDATVVAAADTQTQQTPVLMHGISVTVSVRMLSVCTYLTTVLQEVIVQKHGCFVFQLHVMCSRIYAYPVFVVINLICLLEQIVYRDVCRRTDVVCHAFCYWT